MLRRFWQARSRTLWLAAGAVAVLLVLNDPTRSAFTGSESDGSSGLPTRAQACTSARQAAAEIKEQFPNTPQAELDAMAKDVCSREPTRVADDPPAPVRASPGCHTLEPEGRGPSLPPRTAEPPQRPIPFFAVRSGTVPASGAPKVGGVQLPKGSRCARFWRTDAGVGDAFGLARRLAAVFSSTGLWPVIWTWPDEPPDAYVMGTGPVSRADSIDPARALRRAWRATGLAETGPFPGIAAGADGGARLAVEPFGDAMEETLYQSERPPGGWVVMLVPVNRPADVYSVLGPRTTIYHTDDEATAVLRSWEERFGAVVSILDPGSLALAVGEPPQDRDDARRLAAEHAAFGVPEEWEGIEATARELQSGYSAHYWAFGWAD